MDNKDPRTYAIIGAAIEVHKVLGCGFLEQVYQEALAIELHKRNIPFRREVEVNVIYKEQCLNTRYRADFVCFDSVIAELKAVKELTEIEEAQIINYLKATDVEVGILLKFGASSLQFQRFINSSNNLRNSKA